MSATAMPLGASAAAPRILETKIIVRGLALRSKIGSHDCEQGRRQWLTADVELDVIGCSGPALVDTFNYEVIVRRAQAIAAGAGFPRLEDFAFQLASACLADPRVLCARVRVEGRKARRLQAVSGAEVTLNRPVAADALACLSF